MKTLKPLMQFIHNSGYLFVVVSLLNDDWVIAHPKYKVKKGQYQRVSNPVDTNRSNNFNIDNAFRFGDKDFLVATCDIVEVFCDYYPFLDLRNLSNNAKHIKKSVEQLVREMGKYIPISNIRITGSLATYKAQDNYSDIDVVLSESDYQTLCNNHFFDSNANLIFRNFEEWISFYSKYDIVTSLDATEFADISSRRRLQFIYNSIETSIFIENNDPFLSLLSSFTCIGSSSTKQLLGTVIYENMSTLPGYLLIKSDKDIFLVANFHRTFQDAICVGDSILAEGIEAPFRKVILMLFDNNCFIKQVDKEENNDY